MWLNQKVHLERNNKFQQSGARPPKWAHAQGIHCRTRGLAKAVEELENKHAAERDLMANGMASIAAHLSKIGALTGSHVVPAFAPTVVASGVGAGPRRRRSNEILRGSEAR